MHASTEAETGTAAAGSEESDQKEIREKSIRKFNCFWRGTMNYIDFDESREFDIILLGRVGIDFNPAYSDDVKEDFKPLKNVHYFEKFVGGSPAKYRCRYHPSRHESRFHRQGL